MTSNYSKKLYDDYEKSQLKLDAILLELSNIKKEQKKELNKITKEFKKETLSLKDTIKDLTKSNTEKDKQIEKLLNEIDRLKN